MIKTTGSGGSQDPFSAARAGSTQPCPALAEVLLHCLSLSAAVPALALGFEDLQVPENHKPGILPKGIWGNTPWQLKQPLGYNLALKQAYLLLHCNAEVHNSS